ncbi:MAG TPA: tripartite tricarboxylate transporter substrate binding protein [Bordetella sp.]
MLASWKHRFARLSWTLLALALALPLHAAEPEGPIRLVVGFPPGGGADYVARQVARYLTQELSQSVIVENKPGANGIIAATEVAHAAPDGHTLLLGVTATQSINPNLYSKLPYDPIRDFTPISEVGSTPLVLVVSPSMPVKSVPDFIHYVKQHNGPVYFASAGNGNITHMAAELFILSTDTRNLSHIPYKGSSPAITDLLGGRVSAYFDTLPSSMPFIRSGQLHALGVTSARRAQALPDLPTIQEQGVPGYEATAWFGLFGPSKLDPDTTQRLYKALQHAFAQPEAQQLMTNQGLEVDIDTPQHFSAMLKADVARWHTVTTQAHIHLD